MRAGRWFLAICVAAFGSMKRFTLREIWLSVCAIGRTMVAREGDTVGRSLYIQRIRRCYRCPIFSKLHACGSPFSEHKELGCFCFMDGAARLPEHRCWLDEHSDGSTEFGWKEI